jgi:uncharacterized protein YndB with AHSA1/START domain
MTEPLTIALDLACPVEHAFAVWTARFGTWWPAGHTVSGCPERIVMQGRVDGRIFERTAEGVEHEWGRVTAWEPPTRLADTWHLRQDPATPTDVEIRFCARGAAATSVEIRHTGWERLGADGPGRRDANRTGWRTLLHYLAAVTQGDPR